jgi:hypothetical protein
VGIVTFLRVLSNSNKLLALISDGKFLAMQSCIDMKLMKNNRDFDLIVNIYFCLFLFRLILNKEMNYLFSIPN